MPFASSDRAPAQEPLSALVDGELGDDEVAPLCRGWSSDPELRRRWHAYHLIGDVLRSDDLASHGARDAAFLARLRGRLEAEPVVLAPEAKTERAARRRWGWRAPAAVAAGFVAVAGTVVVLQRPAPLGEMTTARSASVAPAAQVVAFPAAASQPLVETAEAPIVVANPTVIRDARLDRYLSAHQQFAGSSALGQSSRFLRAATVEAPAR